MPTYIYIFICVHASVYECLGTHAQATSTPENRRLRNANEST